jgi:hypothetical protein
VGLPYGVGNFQGIVVDAPKSAHLSGLLDSVFRFSVNLKGGPAMQPDEFMKWQQKLLIGVSFKIVPPTGQYDPTKLINWGTNRWAFKPELGVSRRWGHWVLDTYGGVWCFTTNQEFFSHNTFVTGTQSQSQGPIVTVEGHLSHDFKPRLWVSLDANFWYGGRTNLNGVVSPNTVQENSRIGVTTSIPITKRQSLKMSYNHGAYTKYGGTYNNVSLGWQYSWLGWPK